MLAAEWALCRAGLPYSVQFERGLRRMLRSANVKYSSSLLKRGGAGMKTVAPFIRFDVNAWLISVVALGSLITVPIAKIVFSFKSIAVTQVPLLSPLGLSTCFNQA